MNDPFNPAVPADFTLVTEGGATKQGQPPPGSSSDPIAAAKKSKQRSNRSEKRTVASAPAGARKKKTSKISWQQLKEKLDANLAGLDKQKLKQVLVACGIAGGVVLTIIAAIKLISIPVLLLGLLGLAGVIAIWDRLRKLPRPV